MEQNERTGIPPYGEFIRALQKNDLKQIRIHFNRFPSNSQRTKWLCSTLDSGITLLHFAIENGTSPDIISLLIEYGSPLNLPTPDGSYPVHQAVETKNLTVLDEILTAERRYNNNRYAVDINVRKKMTGETALFLAVKQQTIDIVRLLLQHGADCDLQDKAGVTPLMMAIMNGDCPCVNELMRHGPDLKLRNNNKQNALYIAMKKDNREIVRLLTNGKPQVVARNAPDRRVAPDYGGFMDRADLQSLIGPDAAPEDVSKKEKPTKVDRWHHQQQNQQPPIVDRPRHRPTRDLAIDSDARERDRNNYQRPEAGFPAQAQAAAPRENFQRAPKEMISPPISASLNAEQIYYKMTSPRRGICLIINNESYMARDLRDRGGAEADEKRLNRVFKSLGFHVEIHKNLPAEKIFWEVAEIAKRDHSQSDCFVCVFLAHGAEGKLFGVDGEEVSLTDLTEPFTNEACRSLRGKPKIFFVQACRGDRRELAEKQRQYYYYESDARQPPDDDQTEANRETGVEDAMRFFESIPRYADFLISYATAPGYVAQRNERDGSVYIQVLCDELEKHGKKYDLHIIITRVNQKVSQMELRDKQGLLLKQMPETRYTLTKVIKF